MLQAIKTYIIHNLMFCLGVIFGAVVASLVTISIYKSSSDLPKLPGIHNLQECLIDEIVRKNE